MCSEGFVQTYVDDVKPLDGLRRCLAARSFRREIIVFYENRLGHAFMLAWNIMQAGYHHFVVLGPGPAFCERAMKVWPELGGCVWSSYEMGSFPKQHLDRYVFMSRAARLGYNVFLTRTQSFSTTFTLRSSPLRCGKQLSSLTGTRAMGGSTYIQNARPDGPAVYAIAEALDRLERWHDAQAELAARDKRNWCWEQMQVADTVFSVIVGRPIAYNCWNNDRNETYARAWETAHMALLGSNETGRGPGVWDYAVERRVPWPEYLKPAGVAAYDGDHAVWMQAIQVPNTKGVWPTELGGELYPKQRGNMSSTWMAMLQEDGLPLWPDPEDPTQAGRAASIKEIFAFTPPWLATTHDEAGHTGYWNRALLGPDVFSPYAHSHVLYTPGGSVTKHHLKLANHHWNWELLHRLHPKGGVYTCSTEHAPVPDVLAFAPELEAREWASHAEWENATRALTRLAIEMGRVVAFPAPRCNLSWICGAGAAKLPLTYVQGSPLIRRVIPYARMGEGFNNLRCVGGLQLLEGCQRGHWTLPGGMIAPEFDHFVEQVRLNGGGEATVPSSMLAAPAEGFNVVRLAHDVMKAFGGPSAGLSRPPGAPGPPEDVVAAGNAPGAKRPKLLWLTEVPKLDGKPSPRETMYVEHEMADFEMYSCLWLRGIPW
ncbi:hypothetical protein HYH03_003757 [Edaphochlamys debaryana]|uniref:Uncharacterized protein n=1 Tax=Edaphochlamys debaryana TaxID=47281 RepID=A0A836C2X9_9CHLO|nr:hypothetical protein HYH03_003757 [Edaphochlamys debaryana]|eukprot:KAG2498506.1 hypothetical protein HYH03_003757 [Edaphochlamys debaryana]